MMIVYDRLCNWWQQGVKYIMYNSTSTNCKGGQIQLIGAVSGVEGGIKYKVRCIVSKFKEVKSLFLTSHLSWEKSLTSFCCSITTS